MSRKLATTIKDSAIPGKYKRVAEAYAAFANNDGTNIFASKGKLAAKAGAASPDTIYRNTPDLIACGLLSVATSHTCRVEACSKGSHHYTGRQGKYTTAYNLHISLLQNAETYLSAKCLKVNAAKCRKVLAAKCGTTQVLKETPAPTSSSLGTNPSDSSALTSGSKKASKHSTPSRLASPKNAKPTPQGLELESEEQKQNQPQEDPHPVSEIEERFWTEDIFTERGELMFNISPKPSAAAIEKGLPLCDRILEHFDTEDEGYKVIAANLVLKYNRAHRGHKFATKDDRKLLIRTPEQYLKALDSDNATLINDYLTHDFDNCELCKQAGVVKYPELIRELINDKREREEHKRAEKIRIAEEARLAKLCGACEKVPFGAMRVLGARIPLTNERSVIKLCDGCYDARYEFQKRGYFQVAADDMLAPRPSYLEAKRAAEQVAVEKAKAAAAPMRMQTFDDVDDFEPAGKGFEPEEAE